MNKHFQLKIEKLALGGFGIGFNEDKAVFVPYTAIGDLIEAELVHERKNMAFARAAAYLERGKGVIQTDCEAFASQDPCGGCDWLMLDYPFQLAAKTELLRELLQPLAPEITIKGTIASPTPVNYRNKAFLPVGGNADGLYYGIYARWSHQIIQHQRCQLHPPLFDTITQRCLEICQRAGVKAYDEASHSGTLRHIGIRCSQDQSAILLVLVTRGAKLPFSNLLVKQLTAEFPGICGIVQNINRERGNVILGPEEKILYGNPWLFDDLCGQRFRIHYRSFWQINTGTANLIIQQIRGLIGKTSLIFDAYSGIGALGLCLASQVGKVLCIEECVEAAADGEVNAQLNDIDNVDYLCARVEDALPALLTSPDDKPFALPDLIILDPPRAGVDTAALQAIVDTGIPRIVYLSCAPMTLARDLKFLLQSGAYKLQSIQPFDMFPQTWHIEVLAVLQRTEH